jgi:hypothetical protein
MPNESRQFQPIHDAAAVAEHHDAPTAPGWFFQLLQDLRQIWSVSAGTGQPALRDYPLRRADADLR